MPWRKEGDSCDISGHPDRSIPSSLHLRNGPISTSSSWSFLSWAVLHSSSSVTVVLMQLYGATRWSTLSQCLQFLHGLLDKESALLWSLPALCRILKCHLATWPSGFFICKGCVISLNQEFATIETFIKVFNSSDNDQKFLPCSTVVLFGFRQYAAEILDDFFLLVLHLWQYGTYYNIARVCVQNEHSRCLRIRQDRARA